jgi:hypothetical protein
MSVMHTPRDGRQQRRDVSRVAAAPARASRDAHIERIRTQQRPDQSNFDDADLSVSPAPQPSGSAPARLTPAQIQAAVRDMRQRLASPLPIPSPSTSNVTFSAAATQPAATPDPSIATAPSAPPHLSLSPRQHTPTVATGADLHTDQQAQGTQTYYETDDESRDVVDVGALPTTHAGMSASLQAPSITPSIGSVTPGGATHTMANQLSMMQQQLHAVMQRLDKVTLERDADRSELQHLRSRTHVQDKSQSHGEGDMRVKREGMTSLPFPSLSPFGSPVTAIDPAAPVQRKIEQIDEHKYDSGSDSKPLVTRHKMKQDSERHANTHAADVKRQAVRMTDLPENVSDSESDDSDEDRVEARDRRPDRAIRVPESVDVDHLDSYPEWAARREQLFPFSNAAHRKLYHTRHTLLSARGRRLEWMRTAIHTRFHPALFGRTARRWFEAAMQSLGAPLETATRTYRTIDLSRPPPCRVPEMAYDPRDVVVMDADDDEHDVPVDSYTYEQLPRPLRYDPASHEVATDNTDSLAERIRRHARHTLLHRAAQAPASPDKAKRRADDSEPGRPCRRCRTNTVYGLKVNCDTCDEALAAWRHEQAAQSWMPAMEPDPAIAQRSEPVVKAEPTVSIKLEPYGSRSTAALPTTRRHMTYREQEQQLTALGERTRDRLRNESSSDVDLREEEESPLGSVLSVVFQPHQRPLLRRLAREDLLTFRDRHAALLAAAQVIAKFDGATSKAPKYLQDLCTQVQTYKFNEQEIVTLMTKTTLDAANMWLQTNLAEVFQLPDKPIQALLMRFKAHYIGAHVVRDIRKQLASTMLTAATPTLRDLDTHYAAYSALLTQLRFSDRFVDDKEVLTEYFASLPLSIRTFIGSGFERVTSINELHREAQKALVLIGSNTTIKTEASLIAVNALPANNDKSDRRRSYSQTRSEGKRETVDASNVKNSLCYHCGDRGHYTGRCPLRKHPQTVKGKAVWARRNQERGRDWEYDLSFYVQACDKWEAEQAQRQVAKGNSHSNRKKSKEVINVDDDKANEAVLYDDEE